MASATLEHWVDGLQASGRYTFLRTEAIHATGASPNAIKKSLSRLMHRGRVVKVKDYFFVVVPLEYQSAGSPPVSWYIHDLMAAMGRPYYVGLLSAAGLHGASHQQPQEFQVVTDRYIRPMSAGRTRIRFFTSKYIVDAACVNMKTPTGSMRVSTPETTAVDLVRFAKSAGHLDHVSTVLAELASSTDPKKLVAAARRVDDVPNIQRLGFILDQVHPRKLTGPLHEWVMRQQPRPTPLRSGRPIADAREDRRWRIFVNEHLEVEA